MQVFYYIRLPEIFERYQFRTSSCLTESGFSGNGEL